MSEKELRDFFADCKLITNISFGKWLDRNNIYRCEFTKFMKGQYNNIKIQDLEILRKDILNNLITFTEIYK